MKAILILAVLGSAVVLAPMVAGGWEPIRHYYGACDYAPAESRCTEIEKYRQDAEGVCGSLGRRTPVGDPVGCPQTVEKVIDAYNTPVQPAVYSGCVEVWQDTNGARGLQREGTPSNPSDHRILHACPPILP